MKNVPVRQKGLAVLLSGIFPGLGQLYNRQMGKGIAFLLGASILATTFLLQVDPEALQKSAMTGLPPANFGQLLLLGLLLFALLLWSLIDAARSAGRSSR